jgi:hypothetical protein
LGPGPALQPVRQSLDGLPRTPAAGPPPRIVCQSYSGRCLSSCIYRAKLAINHARDGPGHVGYRPDCCRVEVWRGGLGRLTGCSGRATCRGLWRGWHWRIRADGRISFAGRRHTTPSWPGSWSVDFDGRPYSVLREQGQMKIGGRHDDAFIVGAIPTFKVGDPRAMSTHCSKFRSIKAQGYCTQGLIDHWDSGLTALSQKRVFPGVAL